MESSGGPVLVLQEWELFWRFTMQRHPGTKIRRDQVDPVRLDTSNVHGARPEIDQTSEPSFRSASTRERLQTSSKLLGGVHSLRSIDLGAGRGLDALNVDQRKPIREHGAGSAWFATHLGQACSMVWL